MKPEGRQGHFLLRNDTHPPSKIGSCTPSRLRPPTELSSSKLYKHSTVSKYTQQQRDSTPSRIPTPNRGRLSIASSASEADRLLTPREAARDRNIQQVVDPSFSPSMTENGTPLSLQFHLQTKRAPHQQGVSGSSERRERMVEPEVLAIFEAL